jgi:hypothetical protein
MALRRAKILWIVRSDEYPPCLLCGIPHNRHTFAVRTLTDWQRNGTDTKALLPVLSTYLGHVEPASTYWYYSDSRVIPIPALLPG